jgi:hypothetical protein
VTLIPQFYFLVLKCDHLEIQDYSQFLFSYLVVVIVVLCGLALMPDRFNIH